MTGSAAGLRAGGATTQIRRYIIERQVVPGLIAGALLGFLVREFALFPFGGWEGLSIKGVLGFALAGGVVSRFRVVALTVYSADVALLAIAGLLGMTPVMSSVASAWVRADSVPASGLDAVVVLSGSVTAIGTLNQTAADRLLSGLELVRRGVAPRIVTTHVVVRPRGTAISSDTDQARLVALAGLTSRWMLMSDEVHSTRDEAIVVSRRVRPLGAQRIAIVTSPMHTRRACATFEAVGLRVTCVPALERDELMRRPAAARDRLAAFRAYFYERLASVWYRYHGWIKD